MIPFLSLILAVSAAGATDASTRPGLFNGRPASNPAGWISADDISGLEFKPQGRAGFTITVSPEGKSQNCEIYESTGDDRTDQFTCALVMKRAQFVSAHDRSGTPVATQYSSVVTWSRDNRAKAHPQRIEFELTVNRLPEGVESSALVVAKILIDEEGRVLDCDDGGASIPQLQRLACSAVMNSTVRNPLADENGKPEKGIIGLFVRFSAAP